MKFAVLIGIISQLLSCQIRNRTMSESVMKEAPAPGNEPASLGIDGPVTWNEVKDAKSGSIETPWSDTYWPLAGRGMADRWLATSIDPALSDQPDTLYQQISQMDNIIKNKPGLLAYLSPAEKYDFLVSPGPVPGDVIRALKQREDQFQKEISPKLQPLKTRFESLRKEAEEIFSREEKLKAEAQEIVAKVAKAEAEGRDEEAKKLKGELDGKIKELQGLNQRFEALAKEAQELAKKKREITKGFYEGSLAYADQIRPYLPMLGKDWLVWANYEVSDIENYDWMGHCHGWAAAALVEEKPKHAVMVEKDGKSVLFTEGDIRGLLTKIWAEQAPQDAFFGARRCNSEKYNLDRRGRILDGTICYDKSDGNCQEKYDKMIYVKGEKINPDPEIPQGKPRGYLLFTDALYAKEHKIGLVFDPLPEDHYSMLVFDSYDEFTKYSESNGASGKARKAVVHLTTGCRDTNAMTFHLALTKLLKEKKVGFVFDKTRSSQVWNQPVFKYEMEYLPIQLNRKDPSGKTTAEPGVPAAIDDIKDPFRLYRAPGTKYLVQLSAKVHFGLENGPKIDYNPDPAKPEADEASEIMNVTYTLELDENQRLIGGEWGPVPLPGKADADKNKPLVGGDVPDFLWYYAKTAKPEAGEFDSQIIDKIHQCSLEPATGKTVLSHVGADKKKAQVEVEYSHCVL